MASELQLEQRANGNAVMLTATGELDVASAAEFVSELKRAQSSSARALVIDLRALTFIDSSGLAALVKVEHESRASGKRLVVIKGPHQVQQLFELTGLAERLTLIDSPDDVKDFV